jgi:hypothetical protein
MEAPLVCGPVPAVHVHATVAGMRGPTLRRPQGGPVGAPGETRLLAASGRRAPRPRASRPRAGVVGLRASGAGRRPLGGGAPRLPARRLVRTPAPPPRTLGCPRRAGDLRGHVAAPLTPRPPAHARALARRGPPGMPWCAPGLADRRRERRPVPGAVGAGRAATGAETPPGHTGAPALGGAGAARGAAPPAPDARGAGPGRGQAAAVWGLRPAIRRPWPPTPPPHRDHTRLADGTAQTAAGQGRELAEDRAPCHTAAPRCGPERLTGHLRSSRARPPDDGRQDRAPHVTRRTRQTPAGPPPRRTRLSGAWRVRPPPPPVAGGVRGKPRDRMQASPPSSHARPASSRRTQGAASRQAPVRGRCARGGWAAGPLGPPAGLRSRPLKRHQGGHPWTSPDTQAWRNT